MGYGLGWGLPTALLGLVALLTGCTPAPQEADAGAASASAGQVRSAVVVAKLSAYAAARVADQEIGRAHV